MQVYAESERGKVVVYVTSLGVVREMLAKCLKVRHIMRNLLVKVIEKDIFMSKVHQQELRDRLQVVSGIKQDKHLLVPQVFVEGQYLGVRVVILQFANAVVN